MPEHEETTEHPANDHRDHVPTHPDHHDGEHVTPYLPIRRVLPWTLLWAASVVIFDQGTKFWAEATLELGVPVPVIGEAIQWRLIYNPGAAFGIGAEFTWILSIVAALAVVGLAVFVSRITSVPWALAAGALLGGAISHLGDRLFREPGFARGEIVDFIDYFGFFVGNIADIALVGGAIAIVLLSLIGLSPRSRVRHEPDRSPATP